MGGFFSFADVMNLTARNHRSAVECHTGTEKNNLQILWDINGCKKRLTCSAFLMSSVNICHLIQAVSQFFILSENSEGDGEEYMLATLQSSYLTMFSYVLAPLCLS